MKISKITIKQLFGIKEWQWDGKNIELVGDNGTGKTSVIDAIRYVLTNSSDREFIVKNGETEGEIYIETDNGLSIDRKARTAMTDYKSVKQNGNVIPSPESFLKTIFTPLQLSPMEFISMDKKTQNATILDMIQYDWNLDTIKEWFGEIPRDVNYEQNILAVLNDIQAENGYYFMHRQDVNRDIRAKKAVIADIGSSLPIDYDGERWEKENLSDLYTEIEKIRKNNETIEKAKRLRDSHDGKIRSFQADKEIKIAALDTEMVQQEKNIESELAQLEERIKALREKKDGLAGVKADKVKVIQSEYEASVSKYEAEQASYAEYADMETTPIDDLMAKANETEKMKGHINEWRRMLNIQKEVDELQSESNSLTEKIELARTLPGTILETAEIPIEGLTVKDGIPLINGLPVSNLSEGEKLDLCIDVAIQNPAGLQIILIDGTEKLSEENRTRLYEKCKKKGLQFIATRTTSNNELTVIEL
jgi:predicted ATP-dependent endonuclease of OLD family